MSEALAWIIAGALGYLLFGVAGFWVIDRRYLRKVEAQRDKAMEHWSSSIDFNNRLVESNGELVEALKTQHDKWRECYDALVTLHSQYQEVIG